MSFENWHKEFEKIWPEHSKISKIFILMGSSWAKYIMFELKKYRGIIFHETEEEYIIWRGIDLPFQNWHRIFYKFWPEHSKVSKIFIWMGSFWEKYILFELKKVHRNNLSWHWRVIQNLKKNDLLFRNWLNWRILEIFTRKVESVKIGTFKRSFCPKQKMYEL